MNKLIVISIMLILLIPIIYSSPLQMILRPKVNNNLQLSTAFNYTFNFTKDNSCTNILYSNTTELTTDSQGISFIELEISNLNQVPDYLCEYRNNVLRKVHKIGAILGSTSLISNSTIGNNLDVTGSINAASFVGNGSLLTEVKASSLDNNIVSASKIIADAVNSTHILDNSILSSKIAMNSINTSHILDSTITDLDISDSTNMTLGQKITFALGEIIDNIVDGWVKITGSLNVTESAVIGSELNVGGIKSDGTGRIVCIKSNGDLGTCTDEIDDVNNVDKCTCG